MGERKMERQLCGIIDERIGKMNSVLLGSLSDEQQIERRIQDVGFRNELMDLINELIEMRKLVERLKDEELIDRPYTMRLEVSAEHLKRTAHGYGTQG